MSKKVATQDDGLIVTSMIIAMVVLYFLAMSMAG